MNAAAELVPFLALGILGSLHCAGMCGPLALSLGLSCGPAASALPRAFLYVLGKGLAYSLLAVSLAGTVALAADGASGGGAAGASLARSALAFLAGAVLILFGLRALGWDLLPTRGRIPWLGRGFEAVLGAIRALPRPAASLGLGLANGFLPCGLSWAAISLGAASPGWLTPVGPLVFGLATGPVLIAIALGVGAIPLAWRARGQRVAGVLLLAFGGLTVARGALPGLAGDTDCCEVLGASHAVPR